MEEKTDDELVSAAKEIHSRIMAKEREIAKLHGEINNLKRSLNPVVTQRGA